MKLTHIHVFCQELEPALNFIVNGLKGKLINKRMMMGAPGAEIDLDGTVIYLKEVGAGWTLPEIPGQVCGYDHLGFFVDDLDKTLAELTAMPGVRLEKEPFVLVERKRRCAFLIGPSNLYVEVVEDLKS